MFIIDRRQLSTIRKNNKKKTKILQDRTILLPPKNGDGY